jgi:hypothetical protein
MRKSRRSRKRQFKRLLQQKPAKDHEVVSISVLGLHDGGCLEARGVHEVRVVWHAEFVVGIVILELFLPEGMDEV